MEFGETVQVLGNLGEFIGAMAVVVTLGYLAVQVRHSKEAVVANQTALEENTRMTRIGVLDQHTAAQSAWRGRVAENDELAAIWLAAGDGLGALDARQHLRFQQYAIEFFNVWRASFAAALAVGHDGQQNHIVGSCGETLATHRGMREVWKRSARDYSGMVVPEFTAAVEQYLSNGTKARWG